MNYSPQLKFYNLHDKYVISCDVIFAIVQLFGTLAVPVRLLGQSLRKHLTFYKLLYNSADFDCIFALITLVVHKIMYFEYLL